MPRFTTVLFDLDGTIIDSIRLILDSFHHTFAVHGLPERSDAEWLAGIGTPLTVQFAPYAADAAAIERLIATYREYNLAHHDEVVRVYPGVPEAVRTLKAAGLRLGVVTSKNRVGTQRGLALAGLDNVMEVLVCADDVTRHKPHREPVDKAVALLGADPATTIFIGDSPHDIHAGNAAGVATGAALWGPFDRIDLTLAEPTHWLESPEQIVPLVLG